MKVVTSSSERKLHIQWAPMVGWNVPLAHAPTLKERNTVGPNFLRKSTCKFETLPIKIWKGLGRIVINFRRLIKRGCGAAA